MPQLNSQAYWTKRTGDIFERLDKTDLKIGSALFNYYEKATSDIGDQLNSFYKQYADENGLSLKDARQRVNSVDLSDYVEKANAYREANEKDPEVLKRLNEQYVSSKMTALELLKAQMNFELLKATKNYHDDFEKYLGDTADFVGKRMAAGFAQSTMNKQAIKAALSAKWFGGNYSSRIWNNGDQFAKSLQETMLGGFTYGRNPKVSAKQLRRFVRDGNNDVHKMKYVTERLARSESTFIANAAIKSRFEKDGIETYEFMATIDKRTSNICRSLNHKEYPIKEYSPGVNAPPMHGNCRSTIAPADSELNKYDKYLKPRKQE
jgi:SPP1 gp7 family putative phage head morphogenesis protein